MEALALDASVAMTWCYPDEHSDYAYAVLEALEHAVIIVPAHWTLEVSNAVLSGERKGRLSPSDVTRFFSLLERLSVIVDSEIATKSFTDILSLARTYRLTSYDAAYLELAMREGLVLATLDGALRAAAESAGVRVF